MNKTKDSRGLKYDDGKLRWDLLPLEDIEEIVRVYTAGAKKYAPNSWQNIPDGYDRYKAAMFRHLLAFETGHEVDEETGCLHLAQVAWNAIAMLHFYKNQKCYKELNKHLNHLSETLEKERELNKYLLEY